MRLVIDLKEKDIAIIKLGVALTDARFSEQVDKVLEENKDKDILVDMDKFDEEQKNGLILCLGVMALSKYIDK